MKINFLKLIILCGLTTITYAGSGEPDNLLPNNKYPKPQLTEKLLFYIQRTHNRNTVIYELNFQPDGKLNPKEPMHPSWIRYEEGGIRKELSFIQNRIFGLDVQVINQDTYLLHFRAYKKREVYLMRTGKTTHYKAMMKINGKMAEFTSLFISSITNALGIPSTVKYIDINGIDPASGMIVNERVIP
jgi:hypothetical protein